MLRVTRPGHITDVVDADLSKYFDTIPHNELLRSVAARIVDRYVLRLIKAWLKALVEETDPDGPRRVSGGKQSTRGTSQGGVVSPLLANRYINRLLRHWRNQGRGEAYRAHIVNYADDCVPRRRWRKRRCRTAREMRVGPLKPAVRSRLQTTTSRGGKEPVW
jgi:retron-type reverse transcriptase